MARTGALKNTGINTPKGKKTGLKPKSNRGDLADQPQKSERSREFDSKINEQSTSMTEDRLKEQSEKIYDESINQSLDLDALPENKPSSFLQKKKNKDIKNIKGGNTNIDTQKLGKSENTTQINNPEPLKKMPYYEQYNGKNPPYESNYGNEEN